MIIGKTERLKTYVMGLDERLQGGIPKGYIVLICGPAGCMKTSFAFFILYNQAKKEKRKGLYICLEQRKDNLLKQMSSLGANLADVKANLFVIDIGRLRRDTGDEILPRVFEGGYRKGWAEALATQISRYKEVMGFEILAIDSLDVLYALTPMENPRSVLFHFFEKLRDLGLTVFLVSEMSEVSKTYAAHGIEEFLCDGIMYLAMIKEELTVDRFINVVKMRNTKHDMSYYPLLVEKGFEIVTK